MYKICQQLGKKIYFIAHLQEERREKNTDGGGRVLGCGVELGCMARPGGCWSEPGTVRDPSVSATSPLVQAGALSACKK